MNRLVLFFILVFAAACASPLRHASDPVFRSEVQTRAGNGGLRHYAGDGPAVLLLSSPGISGRIFDIPNYGGLAPYLQHRGFDVWVLDWHPMQQDANWNQMVLFLGDTLRHLSAAHPGLLVLAHGLGGVAVIASAPHPLVKRYVFVAVPGNLKAPLQPINDFAAQTWRAPQSLAGYAKAKLYADLLWSYGIAPLHLAQVQSVFEPVGPALLQDIAGAIRAGTWGAPFQMGLKKITQPASVFVAQTDGVAPPWQTYATYQNLASEKKGYRFFSRANGETREFGHLSVLVGRDAASEIYPLLVEGLVFDGE